MGEYVSIILPVYNCEHYIGQCISSILNQTYKNFELVIINDGSTDETLNIINRFEDDRIRLYDRENKGLIATLNELIQLSKYDFIARMDGDDICVSTRIEEQMKKINEGYDIVSSNAIVIDNNGNEVKVTQYPTTQKEIIAHLCFNSPFIHPAVLARKKIFDIGYSDKYIHAEDYCLWVNALLKKEYRAYCIKKPLLKYRVHENSVSQANITRQADVANCIRNNEISNDDIDNHFSGARSFVKRPQGKSIINVILSGVKFILIKPTRYKLKIFIYVVYSILKSNRKK